MRTRRANLWTWAVMLLTVLPGGGFAQNAGTNKTVAAKPPTAPPAPEPPKGGAIGNFFRSVKEAVGMTPDPVHLFNGKKLDDNFYTWLKDGGVYADSHKVFTVDNGVLRISGQKEGYLATKSQFSDFRLVAEYKWGEVKWPPREDKPRNSGLFVCGTGQDHTWMKGIECQIAEGGTGNLVLHGGAQLTVGKETKTRPWSEFNRTATNELEVARGKWNTLEILCEGGHLQVKVNGHVSMEGFSATPSSGRVLLQSNGAEIFFRRLDIYPLNFNSPSGSTGN